MDAKNQPIIIKKIVKGHAGHHGGSWKVAFADFAIAMMAFFMLMWLLGGPTSEEQKAGISEFFRNPSIFIGQSSVAGPAPSVFGPPSKTGLTMMTEMTKGDKVQIEISEGGKKINLGKDRDARIAMDIEQQRLEELLAELKASVEASQALKPFKDQLKLDITPEGLRIQILDKENRPMFDSGGDTLKDHMVGILHAVAETIIGVPNKISITGHTDATPFFGREGYSNWELSADRANAARRELMRAGIPQDKISRIVGLSDVVLFDKANPKAAINRRISIIVMARDPDVVIEADREAIEKAKETGISIDSTTGDEALDKAIIEGITGIKDGEVAPAEGTPLTMPEPLVMPSMPQVGPAIEPPSPVQARPKVAPDATDQSEEDSTSSDEAADEATDEAPTEGSSEQIEVAPAEVEPPPEPLSMPPPVVIPSIPKIGPAIITPAPAKRVPRAVPDTTAKPKTEPAPKTDTDQSGDNKVEEAPKAEVEKKQPKPAVAPKPPVAPALEKEQSKPTSIGPKTPMIAPIQLPFPEPPK